MYLAVGIQFKAKDGASINAKRAYTFAKASNLAPNCPRQNREAGLWRIVIIDCFK